MAAVMGMFMIRIMDMFMNMRLSIMLMGMFMLIVVMTAHFPFTSVAFFRFFKPASSIT